MKHTAALGAEGFVASWGPSKRAHVLGAECFVQLRDLAKYAAALCAKGFVALRDRARKHGRVSPQAFWLRLGPAAPRDAGRTLRARMRALALATVAQ